MNYFERSQKHVNSVNFKEEEIEKKIVFAQANRYVTLFSEWKWDIYLFKERLGNNECEMCKKFYEKTFSPKQDQSFSNISSIFF